MISPKIYFILYLVSQIVVDVNLNKITVLEYIQLVLYTIALNAQDFMNFKSSENLH